MNGHDKKPLLFKVSSKSNIHKVSEAIYKTFLEEEKMEIQAIGGGAVNQAAKAIAIAAGKLSTAGKHTAVIIGFRDIPVDEETSASTSDTSGRKTISALNFSILELSGKMYG